jgi:hypothetical protein
MTHDVDQKCVLCIKLRMMAKINGNFFLVDLGLGDDPTVSSLEESDDDSLDLTDFQMTKDEMKLDQDDLAILGNEMGEYERLVGGAAEAAIESKFCSSVRNKVDGDDDAPHFNGPTYKERMVGLSRMIENWCGTDLSALTTIAGISKWTLFKTDFFSLSVRIRMKNLDGITMLHFGECYLRMKELYEGEMLKESSKKKMLNFHDYCEELVEFWALADMTLDMLVSEEGSGFVSVMDLLQFAPTRICLVSVIERAVLHHFQDSDPGGGTRALKGRVNADENKLLAVYRINVKNSGEQQLDLSVDSTISTDNVNYVLLLQFLCVQKRYSDSSKSAKRKLDELNQDAFLKTVQSFSDHLIARLRNLPTDEDMMQFIFTELELVTNSFEKEKGVNV